jgi:hypothetical protein
MRLVKFVDARAHVPVWVNPEDVTIVSSIKGHDDQACIYYGRDRLEIEGAPADIVKRLLHPAPDEEA